MDAREQMKQVFDPEQVLGEIKKLITELNLHKDDKLPKNPPNKDEIIAKFKALQTAISHFRKFNAEFFEAIGLTEKELIQSAAHLPKGSEAEKVMKMSHQLKIDLLLSYAQFVKKIHERNSANPLFTQGESEGVSKESQKKAIKQKFKNMEQRSKWKKM